jgi:hypothetical protein
MIICRLEDNMYFCSMIKLVNSMKKKVLFSIIGGIIGIPLSYFFQPEIVKSKVGGIGG